MISFLLFLAICGAIGYYVWKNFYSLNENTKKQPSKKPYSKEDLRIENVGPGAVIHLTGIGPDLDEFDLKIIAKHTYRQGDSSWYELECDKGSNDKVWIDMEEDDELELAISLRKLMLDDLGITKKDLVKMDDDERGNIEFEGQKYYLDDSDEAVFYRYNDDKNAERFYYWDFAAKDGRHFISVEKWSDGSYDVTYSEAIRLSQVTVYSIK